MTRPQYVRRAGTARPRTAGPRTALAKRLHVFLLFTADPQEAAGAPRTAGARGRERRYRLRRDPGRHHRLRAPAHAAPQAKAELRRSSRRAPASAARRSGPGPAGLTVAGAGPRRRLAPQVQAVEAAAAPPLGGQGRHHGGGRSVAAGRRAIRIGGGRRGCGGAPVAPGGGGGRRPAVGGAAAPGCAGAPRGRR